VHGLHVNSLPSRGRTDASRAIGHYKGLEYDENTNSYETNDLLGIQVDVDVRPFFLSFAISSLLTHGTVYLGNMDFALGRKDAGTFRRTLHIHLSRSGRPLDLPFDKLHNRLVLTATHQTIP
jgi:hypothetical protein